MIVIRRALFIAPTLAALAVLAGCVEQEEVVSYTVPKPHVLEEQNPPKATTPTDTDELPTDREPLQSDPRVATDDAMQLSAEPRDRMLAAIVPQGDQFWFFKVTGPKDAAGEQIDEFYSFIRSIRFADDGAAPQWSLPEGWNQKSGSSMMRYATLEVPSPEGPLELSVIPLPNQSVLDNVNRWLGEMGVADITQEQLEAGVELKTGGDVRQMEVDGRTVTLVNAVGTFQGRRMTGAPFASGLPRDSASPPSPSTAGPSPLTYEVPEGWRPGQVSGFRKAAFEVADGGEKAEVTVIDLAAGAGNLLPNVNRWRGEIGLGPTTEEDVREDLQTIPVGDTEGLYVHLVGPEEATLGVIAIRGDKSWYLKMRGEKSLVEREQQNFEQFVRSVEFK